MKIIAIAILALLIAFYIHTLHFVIHSADISAKATKIIVVTIYTAIYIIALLAIISLFHS